MMMSLSKPGSLLVVCNPHANGASHPKLSPTNSHGSWKDSLDDLSKELQKICHSPISNPGSPMISRNSPDTVVTTPSPDANTSPGALKKQGSGEDVSFPQFHIPAVLVQSIAQEHNVLRVRHEETKDLLQKRLSMISGYKLNNSDDNLPTKRRPSKEMAALAKMKQQGHANRFRTLVNIGDCPHEELKVICKSDHLALYQISKAQSDVELRRVDIPDSLDLERLICTIHGQSLEIMEYPKKVIFTETTGLLNSDKDRKHHCPTVVDDIRNNLWKLVWNVPDQFQTTNVSVRTLDEKLIIMCKERSISGNNALNLQLEKILGSGGGNGTAATQKQINMLATAASNNNGHHTLKITIELPENVEPKTVSAIVTKNKQLIIQGISSWRTRCVTY